jgi:hypothetical protein
MCIYHDARWQLDKNASWTKEIKEKNKEEKIKFYKVNGSSITILMKICNPILASRVEPKQKTIHSHIETNKQTQLS